MAKTLQKKIEEKTGQLELGLLRKFYKPGRIVIATALINHLYHDVQKYSNWNGVSPLRAEFDEILGKEIEATDDLERKTTLEVMGIISKKRRDVKEYTMQSDSPDVVLAVINHFKEDALFNSGMVMDLYEQLGMEEEAREYALEAIAKLEEHPCSGTNSGVRRELYKRIGDYENAFEVAVRAHDFGDAEKLIPHISGTREESYRRMIEASRDPGIYRNGYLIRIEMLEKIGADEEEITAEKRGLLELELKGRKVPRIELAQEVGTREQLAETYDQNVQFHLREADRLFGWEEKYIDRWQKVLDTASKAFDELNDQKYADIAGKARGNIIRVKRPDYIIRSFEGKI